MPYRLDRLCIEDGMQLTKAKDSGGPSDAD